MEASRRDRLARIARRLAGGALAVVLTSAIWLSSFSIDRSLFDGSRGGPLVVTDRHGAVIARVPSVDGRPGRNAWVPLREVESHALLAFIASEDETFLEHRGVEPFAFVRAAWATITTQRLYGGSTITMQLARLVYAPDGARSITKKLLQVRAALALERTFSKEEILEQYVNRAYFGHGAYGIDAAARRYFGKPSRALSAGEAMFLAVLPRGPEYYDPIAHLDRALARRRHIARLMVEKGRMSQEDAELALEAPLDIRLHPWESTASMFVANALRSLPADIRRRGGIVETTLDASLQAALEHRVREHVADLADFDVEQAGVVVLDARRNEVLASVGSVHGSPQSGVDITTWRRHPGSALKPFVYAAAIERGASPSTIAFDVREASPMYDRDGPQRGPVSYRDALAGSFNYAAVDVAETIGTAPILDLLQRASVVRREGHPAEYGPLIALGAPLTRLVDVAGAYRFVVRDGRVGQVRYVREVREGDLVTYRPPWSEEQLVSPETAWLVMDMLADADARRATFGVELPTELPYPIVAKTGTAEGFSDMVAVFATRELIVAAWTGRFDGRPIDGLYAMRAAAPLARAALLAAARGRPLTLPRAPPTIVRAEVCPLSGRIATRACPHRRLDSFAPSSVPTDSCEVHVHDGERAQIVWPERARPWARRQAQPPLVAARD